MMQLPVVSDRKPLTYPWFPAVWQTVLFRCFGKVPNERLAAVLQTDVETLCAEADRLGLDGAMPYQPEWLRRGYITLIRACHHLLPFSQLCALLDLDGPALAFILKEDDFLWHKLGHLKPDCPPVAYQPLTEEQIARTEALAAIVREQPVQENAFSFLQQYAEDPLPPIVSTGDGLRMVYSYFALYGDPLADPSLDPFPDGLLRQYAEAGVNGVWMQGVLYQLTRFPFDPAMSKGYEQRQKNLQALCERAARYGIGVYLYFNEPRAMPDGFFQKYPDLRGAREEDFYAMCTSHPDVAAYLETATCELFSAVPALAGFFTISMSENLTHCYSRSGGLQTECPRCAARRPQDVTAEVNNLLARGARRAKPDARITCWNWAWHSDWTMEIPALLTEGQVVQCTSETNLPFTVGSVSTSVQDYSMSHHGPAPEAIAMWQAARDAGHACCAKVQCNNTWECAAVPFIPAFDLVAAHITALLANGVQHFQLSWTLGGCPSPNLALCAFLMDGKGTTSDFCRAYYGSDGTAIDRCQQQISAAFREFPFHILVVYNAPMNYGPAAPFFAEPTGWQATMVGFPYDDLESWRVLYPRDLFEQQFERVCEGWKSALDALQIDPSLPRSAEFARIAEATYLHFRSTLHHIRFVMAREAGDRARMQSLIRDEDALVCRMLALRKADSRIGYEASNHYFYSVAELVEKRLSLRYVQEAIGC